MMLRVARVRDHDSRRVHTTLGQPGRTDAIVNGCPVWWVPGSGLGVNGSLRDRLASLETGHDEG